MACRILVPWSRTETGPLAVKVQSPNPLDSQGIPQRPSVYRQKGRNWYLGWASGKEPACQCRRIRDSSLISGWEDPLEEGMATHSSILAWRILWTEKPGRLQSVGLQRVEHNWSDLAAAAAEVLSWRRAWQPTPVFLPGESYGQRSLAGYSPWGCKESDITEVT